MDQTPHPPAADACPQNALPPFPVHALWFMLCAGLNLFAAIASFNYNGRGALVYGALALVSGGLGFIFSKLAPRCSAPAGSPGALPPVWVLSIGAAGGLCLSFALLARRVARGYTGFSFISGVYALHDGLLASCLSLAAVLLVLCGFWLWRWWATGLPGSSWRRVLASAGVALCAFMVGPRLEFRLISPEGLVVKRSLIEVLQQPFGRTAVLKLQNTGLFNANGDETIVSCVSELGWAALFLAKTRALEEEGTPDGDEARKARAEVCKAESDAALASGAAPETLLFKGDVAGYLARALAQGALHPVGVQIEKLPPPLGTNLLALLPEERRMKYLPFDVALAAGLKAQADALMPGTKGILPYQRQAMFALGLAERLDGEAGKTAESIAEERSQTTQTMLQIGTRLGNADMMRTALMYGLSGSVERTNFSGGYTGYDFYYVNRSCDLPYAEFLAARGLRPEGVQRLHLLSSIGLAQYPGYNTQQFKYAENAFGQPAQAQLKQCLALARWYAANATEQSAEEIDAIYEHIAAARMAWFEVQRNTPDKTLPGGRGLASEAATAMLERLPPSFPQYCAWTNTIFWSLLEPTADEGPFALEPLLGLQASWQGRAWADVPLAVKTNSWGEPMFREFDARGNELPPNCPLLQMGYTNQPAQTLARLNQRLKELGVPCQGKARPNDPGSVTPKHPVLNCQKS